MKKNISIILSLIALVAVLGVILVWIFRGYTISVVSLDTFIGVMVAIVGLLVTFAVGWQIVNALEIKSKLAEIKDLKDNIEEQQATIDELSNQTQYDSLVIRGLVEQQRKNYLAAAMCNISALMLSISFTRPNKQDSLIKSLEANLKKISSSVSPQTYDLLLKADKEIKESLNYPYIEERYKERIIPLLKNLKVENIDQ